MARSIAILLCLASSAFAQGEPAAWSQQQLDFFEAKIRPVLIEHCYECHAAGAKTVQGSLRLDSRQGLLTGGDRGAAIVPGQPDASLLLQALRHEELEMPPKGRLPDDVIRDFATWIATGAADPRQADAPPATRVIDLEAGRQHWAFQPVTDPSPPGVSDPGWPRDVIDRFLLARLDEVGLRPMPDADRYTWLRRVHFDLTGLPPTQAESAAFADDRSPRACETVVDRLLSSRAYGERWARHWLDLTGYADQVGTSNSVFAEHAWRYRDYLIDAFHADKPFDQLLREQIAGDLLPEDAPEERAANIVATGFLLLGDVEIVNPDKLRLETDHIDQQVSKIGTVFLGMTVGCARCHDHKFDPIGQDDYYALAGIFRSTASTHKIPNGIWSGLNIAELPETAAQVEERRQRQAEHQQRLAQLDAEREQLRTEQTALAAEQNRSAADTEQVQSRQRQIAERLRQLAAEREHAEFFAPTVPRAFAVHDAEQPGDMAITIRGNPYALGAVVPRGMLRVAEWEATPKIPPGQSGRLELADWLADPRHPLTARVAVNRIWQKLFGEGLVRTVDYFGTRGELPTHPALLDHLATRFVRGGWSQKQLIRTLVLTRAYRMSSEHDAVAAQLDPDNRLLWRMNRQRLDAESIRDAMLLASGELLESAGGPAMPLEYLENTGSLAAGAVNPPSFTFRRFRPQQEFERTVYLPVVRSAQPAPARLRDVFDFTQPAQISGQRSQTVVPTQALYLLNDELPRRRAAALATRLLAADGPRDERLERLWLRVLNRPLTLDERSEAGEFLDRLTADGENRDAEITAWTELVHALLGTNEFIYRL